MSSVIRLHAVSHHCDEFQPQVLGRVAAPAPRRPRRPAPPARRSRPRCACGELARGSTPTPASGTGGSAAPPSRSSSATSAGAPRTAPPGARCRRRSARPARRGRRRCRGACSSCARPRITISWNRQPANGSPSARNASGPMSRSALVTIRWSNTKLPLSEPATSALGGQPVAQVRQREDLLERVARAPPAGTHAGTHSHSASKWQSSVSVSRRAGPPQLGQVVLHELLELGQRVAGAGRADVERQQHRQLLARHRHGAAAARSRRSGSACPTSAGARSRSRWRGSAPPARAARRAAPSAVPAAGVRRCARAGARSPARRSMPSRRAITSSVRSRVGHAEHGRRPEARVDERAR